MHTLCHRPNVIPKGILAHSKARKCKASIARVHIPPAAGPTSGRIDAVSTPHKCPVCDGEGKRGTKHAGKKCKACEGSGVVWAPECVGTYHPPHLMPPHGYPWYPRPGYPPRPGDLAYGTIYNPGETGNDVKTWQTT